MARRWPLLALALVAAPVGAVVGHGLGDEPRPAPATPSRAAAAPDPALASLRAEVDALWSSVETLGARAPAAAPPAPSPDGDRADDADAADDAAADAADTVDDQVARFADALAADAVDVAWSADAERRLRDAFTASAPIDAALDEVTCRARLCRLALRFPSPEARAAGVVLLPNLVPWDTTGILHTDEDDPARAILYATRGPGAI